MGRDILAGPQRYYLNFHSVASWALWCQQLQEGHRRSAAPAALPSFVAARARRGASVMVVPRFACMPLEFVDTCTGRGRGHLPCPLALKRSEDALCTEATPGTAAPPPTME